MHPMMNNIWFVFLLAQLSLTAVQAHQIGNHPDCGRLPVLQTEPVSKSNKPFPIYGGHYTTRFKYPWMARLERIFYINDPNSQYQYGFVLCGASILHERWALTAAHCFFNNRSKQYPIENFLFFAGRFDFSQPETDTEQVRELELVLPHPAFRRDFIDYDVALIKLTQGLKFGRAVATVCLPTTKQSVDLTGVTMTMLGWGYCDWGKLREFKGRVWSDRKCKRVMSKEDMQNRVWFQQLYVRKHRNLYRNSYRNSYRKVYNPLNERYYRKPYHDLYRDYHHDSPRNFNSENTNDEDWVDESVVGDSNIGDGSEQNSPNEYRWTKRFLCWGVWNALNLCEGDSGGPMVVFDPNFGTNTQHHQNQKGRWVQYGVSSHHMGVMAKNRFKNITELQIDGSVAMRMDGEITEWVWTQINAHTPEVILNRILFGPHNNSPIPEFIRIQFCSSSPYVRIDNGRDPC